MTERFSVTYWPGGAQPIPALDVPDHVERVGDWLRLGSPGGSHAVELPTEFHLRDCRDVDLDDLDAVCQLVARFGSPLPLVGGTTDLPGRVEPAIARQASEAGRYESRRKGPPQKPDAEWLHVDDVIYRLRVLRQLSAHAVAYRRSNYVADAWPDDARERNASSIRALWRAGKRTPPSDDSAAFRDALDVNAWQDFVLFTGLALRPFHVRVWVNLGHQGYNIGTPRPTLYEAAVLQIVNDLAEHVDYRDCPHCHRTFGRQVGRAQHGQNRRTGVTYCSPSCASAARVKAYRARQRAEKKG